MELETGGHNDREQAVSVPRSVVVTDSIVRVWGPNGWDTRNRCGCGVESECSHVR